jgi:hypothetical protein
MRSIGNLKLGQWRKLFTMSNSSSLESINKFGAWESVKFGLKNLEMIEYWKNHLEYLKGLNGPRLYDRPTQLNSIEPNNIWIWPKATAKFLQRGAHQDAKPTAPVAESYCRWTLSPPRSERVPPHVCRCPYPRLVPSAEAKLPLFFSSSCSHSIWLPLHFSLCSCCRRRSSASSRPCLHPRMPKLSTEQESSLSHRPLRGRRRRASRHLPHPPQCAPRLRPSPSPEDMSPSITESRGSSMSAPAPASTISLAAHRRLLHLINRHRGHASMLSHLLSRCPNRVP